MNGPYRLLTDQPTLTDELDRAVLIGRILDAVIGCRPPQVFGVHGEWGPGKTSLLRQLQFRLTEQCQGFGDDELARATNPGDAGAYRDTTFVVWFEAWRYQNEAVPIVALLHEMREQLDWQIRTAHKARKLAEVTLRSSLMAISEITKLIGVNASIARDEGEAWEREHLATQLPSHTIRDQLEHAIDALLKSGARRRDRGKEHRVVVLIDDLDRCEPEAAHRLLEGLKIYLTLRNCVFVIGMNQRSVEDAIARQLPQRPRARTTTWPWCNTSGGCSRSPSFCATCAWTLS